MMEDLIAFRSLPSEAQIGRVLEILGDVVQVNYRHETALNITVRLICGEVLTPEELRSCYLDDSARLIDVVRNKWLIPLHTHKDGSYSMLLPEATRFLNPEARLEQRDACSKLQEALRDRRKARCATDLERDYGRHDLPEWYHEQARRQLPNVRRGVADFERG